MDLTNRSELISLLQKHKLWTKKFLGQNFLINKTALDQIIEAPQITSEDYIIEIGPGVGTLTQKLAEKAKKVTSVELDKTLFTVLVETVSSYKNVNILYQDGLQFTPPETPYKVVANIPYNITSPLLNHFLQAENPPQSITFLVQKEVAEKVCKSEPDHTVLSLQVHLFGSPKIIAIVKADSFLPAPKVDSAILHINIHNKIPKEEALEILKLAKRAFLQRRKKLSNTIPDLIEKLKNLSLEEKRPQHLSIKDWQSLLN